MDRVRVWRVVMAERRRGRKQKKRQWVEEGTRSIEENKNKKVEFPVTKAG